MVIPVSYTHLDVYKRQFLNRRLSFFRNIIRTEIQIIINIESLIHAVNLGYLWPVSYTHLDVYKRQALFSIVFLQLGEALYDEYHTDPPGAPG